MTKKQINSLLNELFATSWQELTDSTQELKEKKHSKKARIKNEKAHSKCQLIVNIYSKINDCRFSVSFSRLRDNKHKESKGNE